MDARLYRDVNHLAVHTSWAHSLMKDLAVYGIGLFAFLVMAGWWYARSSPDAPRAVAASIWTAVGTIVAVGINQPIVSAVGRQRPFVTMSGMEVLVGRTHDFSFPSDHAVAAGAATAGLWIIASYGSKAIRRLAVGGTLLAILVAFARVYVGAHYPGDVVTGLAIGAIITAAGWLALNRALTHLIRRVADQQTFRPLVISNHAI